MPLRPLADPRALSAGVAEILRPPRRIAPSEALAKYLRNHEGPWDAALAPMQIEPLDLLTSRRYQGIVYVGPSRGSKTYTLIVGGMAWAATCAPADMLIVQMTKDKAREFSKKDIDRAIRHSPELAARISPRPRDDNVFDKYFRSGMVLNIGWPAVSQLSGSTFKYAFSTDYDRPENRDDVDGEGSLWDLLSTRVKTFMSRGKALAESSPGGEYLDPQWQASSPHEAPPATGILSVYNRGTRARWYWPCKHCSEHFEARPGIDIFNLPPFEELAELVKTRDLMVLAEQYARIACPNCGGIHEVTDKPLLNARGRWVHAGESIDARGTITGERRRTDIASFWQGGCASTYQTWLSLVFNHLQAILEYTRTGDEGALKTKTNTEQAAPYLSRAIAKRRSGDALQERVEDLPRGIVPLSARFLTFAVDVQASRFVIEVHAWGEYLERWIVDRFSISSSRRPEGDRFAALDPAGYVEDWEVLVEPLLERVYPVHGLEGAGHAPLLGFCDSGGKEGVTQNAYRFWRNLRARGFGARFMLIKGLPKVDAKLAEMTWPDVSGRKDRASGAKGDVPVWLLNVNQLKDTVSNELSRATPGPGFVHLPKWLERSYFDELTAETRDTQGRWKKPQGVRNESLDLHVYNRAAAIALKADRIDWRNPPTWAAPITSRSRTNPTQPTPPAASGRRMRNRGVPNR